MKRKEQTKAIYDDFKWKKPFGLYDLYKKYVSVINQRSVDNPQSANHVYTAVQTQNAVSAYFTSKQILPFGFADQYSRLQPFYLSF